MDVGAAGAVRFIRAGAVVGLLVVAFALWAPARSAWAAATESISSYDSRVEVRADGTLRVSETIAYDFGGAKRHGIVRNIPVRVRVNDTHDRVFPIDDVNVTMDGSAARVDPESSGNDEVLRIGDPDQFVSGAHTYVIGYTVRGVLNSFPDHEELNWNLVGTEWPVPIATATGTVTGPAAIQRVECFAGPRDSRLSCAAKSFDGATATFRQSGLGDGSGLTAVVAFPAGSVANTAPILVERHDATAAFRATPATVGGAAGLALLGIGLALYLVWRVGRDKRYVGQLPGLTPGIGQSDVEERKPLTGAPPVSVEFGPPEHIRPGQAGTLIDEKADVLDVTATIIDFAVRRHLHIRELAEGPRDWELTKLTDGDPKFRPYETTLFLALFKDRDTVRLSELRGTFASDLGQVQHQLYRDMVTQGWYRESPATTRIRARRWAVLALLAAAAITVLLAITTHAALFGLGLVAAAIALLVVSGRFPARTGRGSAMLARVQGFRLYMSMAEAEQMKFQEREQIFSEFLPYAIVFGLADRWAAIFARAGMGTPESQPGQPGLYWYGGIAGWSLLSFHQSIGTFTAVTSGTVASVAATASASGVSGFSGGGFSGGGMGGGGGGSW